MRGEPWTWNGIKMGPVRQCWCGLALAMLLRVVLCVPACPALALGAEWIPFNKQQLPGESTTMQVLESSADSVVVRISCPGVVSEEVLDDGKPRIKLKIPGETSLEHSGLPAVPTVRHLVAVPSCDKIEVSAKSRMSQRVEISHYLSMYKTDAEYAVSATDPFPAELWGSPFPKDMAEWSGPTAIRDLNVLCLTVFPVQYVHSEQLLLCHSDITLTLRFVNPQPFPPGFSAGPFDKICSRHILAYPDQIGPLTLASSSQSTWTRCGGADPLQCCVENGTDYLIMAPSEFFNNAWIDSLAAKRAAYNGFNVSIVNVDRLGAYSARPDSAVRSFLTSLYDSETAGHMPDGHIAYVLLVGTFLNTEGDTLFPAHIVETARDTFPNDTWFACVNDPTSAQPFPDMLIGRLCARDTTDLRVLISKTLGFEPLPADSSGWSSTFLLTTARNIKPETEQEAVDRVLGKIEDLARSESFNVRKIRGEQYAKADSVVLRQDSADGLNAGAIFMDYWLHTQHDGCWLGNPPAFSCTSVEMLDNRDSLCVVYTQGCQAANFADPHCFDGRTSESIGSKFTIHPAGGAVAFIGPTPRGSAFWLEPSKEYSLRFFESILKNHTPFIAEALTEVKLHVLSYPSGGSVSYIDAMTLLGDPALNVRLRRGFEEYCDLGISPSDSDLVFMPPNLEVRPSDGVCSTRVWVRNKTPIGVPDTSISVRFDAKCDLDPRWINLGVQYVDSIPPWSGESALFVWSYDSLYTNTLYTFRAWVDSEDVVTNEAYAGNNITYTEKAVASLSQEYCKVSGEITSPVSAYFSSGGQTTKFVIVGNTDGVVYAISPEGEQEADYRTGPGAFSAAVGDLDRTGTNLQVVSCRRTVYALNLFGTNEVEVWSAQISDTISTPPSLGDFDGDVDGDLEVAVGSYDDDAHITIVDSGTVISVWDLGSAPQIGYPLSLLLMDVDSDSNLDIVAGTSKGFVLAVSGSDGQILWQYDVSPNTQSPTRGPVAGDIDWDGSMEIVAGGDSLYVFAAASSCSLLTSMQLAGTVTALSLGDWDEDWDPLATEIMAGYAGGFCVVQYTSDPVPSVAEVIHKELPSPPRTTPLVGDILGGQQQREIIFLCENDTLYVLQGEDLWIGELESGGPSGCVPLLSDIRQDDGRPELIYPGPVTGQLLMRPGDGDELLTDWAMEGNDPRHTNVHAYTLSGWSEGRHFWSGRYRIPDLYATTGTLKIEPGTRIEVGKPRGAPDPDNWWEGTLSFIGTEITAHGTEAEPIVFTTAAPLTFPQPEEWWNWWGGILFEYLGSIDLRHCIIEKAGNGCVCAYASMSGPFGSATHCTFKDCGYGGYAIGADSCSFIRNYVGIYGGAYHSYFSDNEIGALCARGGAVGNEVTGTASSFGIKMTDMTSSGGLIDCDPPPALYEVRENRVEGCGQAGMIFEAVWDSAFFVTRNSIWDCGTGMHFRRLECPCSTVAAPRGWTSVVRDTNGIGSCDIGILCDSAAVPFMGDSTHPGLNEIWDITGKAVKNEDDSLAVPAKYNWWGLDCSDADTVAQMFEGLVDIEPCLEDRIWAGVGSQRDPAGGQPVRLFAGVPNPFKSSTSIKIVLPRPSRVKIEIYDVRGRRVAIIADASLAEGSHNFRWEGTASSGQVVASGIYFCRLSCDNFRTTSKIVLLR